MRVVVEGATSVDSAVDMHVTHQVIDGIAVTRAAVDE